MKLRSILKWMFQYLPVRFSLPFIGLLAWFLFYLWPWLLDVVFPSDPAKDVRDTLRAWVEQWLVPGWVDVLNLTPAAKAFAVLTLLGAGVLGAYNLAAVWYQAIRRWRRENVVTATVLLNLFIYSYPWLLAPKDWTSGTPSLIPFYIRMPWFAGFSYYGVLWALPAAIILATLCFELTDRRRIAAKQRIAVRNIEAELPPIESQSFEQLRASCNSSRELRIGLILSGGGAKGVYQAGAMRAIYEFLQQYDCLRNVKMIAGTSIGSWNSLFWLAGLIERHSGQPSAHEAWWTSVNIERIIAFDRYVPFVNNSMLTPKPWRENFAHIFGNGCLEPLLQHPKPMHFYLTRSNVAQGRLEFSTNWGPEERKRALMSEDIQIDSFTETRSVDDIRDAVFASMDLPPLFPYQRMDGKFYEDGGVIDNLPIRFATLVEECDLLFVLALNSSFEEVPDQHSIIKRLMRVTDVRQGVLERNSMRLTYLYNSMASLGAKTAAHKSAKLVRVFAICPQQPLAVNTSEFWKTELFESAFHMMYDATRVELSKFDFMAVPDAATKDEKQWLRMALVSPAGEITYNYRF